MHVKKYGTLETDDEEENDEEALLIDDEAKLELMLLELIGRFRTFNMIIVPFTENSRVSLMTSNSIPQQSSMCQWEF